MVNLHRYTSLRLNPSQLRGKERIRVILATAIKLFHSKGIDQTTTNDIAEAAGIPIGSIYRYFSNKEEIILALTDLYVEDVIGLFKEIAENPLLSQLSWQELLIIVTDTWAHHCRLNGTFSFVHFLWCNRYLASQTASRGEKVFQAYVHILQKRDETITLAEASIYLPLNWSAVEISVSQGNTSGHQATNILAAYLEQLHPGSS